MTAGDNVLSSYTNIFTTSNLIEGFGSTFENNNSSYSGMEEFPPDMYCNFEAEWNDGELQSANENLFENSQQTDDNNNGKYGLISSFPPYE